MKKLFLTLVALVAMTMGMKAQQIAVVKSDGTTSVFSLLADAINAAESGSVIYLPGGSFPIADEVKINQPITIIGIGHKWNSDNADEYDHTTVTGNLFFEDGSKGSAVMGIYLTGDIYIGNDGKKVDNILVRWCNISELFVKNNTCMGTVVNQNYIRDGAWFDGARGEFTNNIALHINNLDNGTIAYNVLTNSGIAINLCDQCVINHNVIIDWRYGAGANNNNSTAIGNMAQNSWGDDPIDVDEDWAEVFENNAGITPNSSYHFKGDYKRYEHQCGIYAGDGFSDSALPPIPYIIAKHIPQQTDSEGKLNIKVRVRASE